MASRKSSYSQDGFFDDGYGYGSGYGYDDDWYGSYYTSRFKSYRDNISTWKKDKSNIVHPEVVSNWQDNSFVEDIEFKRADGFPEKIQETIPGSVGGDIYRLLYHDAPQITKPEDQQDLFWFDELSSLPIYGLRMQTTESSAWSKVAAQAIVRSIYEAMKRLNGIEQQDQDRAGMEHTETWEGIKFHINKDKQKAINEQIKNAMSGKGDQKTKDAIRQAMRDGIEAAQKDIQKNQQFLQALGINPNEIKDKQQKQDGKKGEGERSEGKQAGDGEIDLSFLEQRAELINALSFNAKKATEFLRETSRFFNTQIGKPKIVRDHLVDASTFHDIVNPETMLFPFQILDTSVLTHKYSTKVDLYIDVSGSMSTALPGTSARGGRLSILDAVSIFAYKLYRLGIVEKVYAFDHTVKEVAPSKILLLNTAGGTSFTNVVNHYTQAQKAGSRRLAFVLTDGCDDTKQHNKNMSWMFIEGGPGDNMSKLYSQDSMRIWSDGNIMKINAWRERS